MSIRFVARGPGGKVTHACGSYDLCKRAAIRLALRDPGRELLAEQVDPLWSSLKQGGWTIFTEKGGMAELYDG